MGSRDLLQQYIKGTPEEKDQIRRAVRGLAVQAWLQSTGLTVTKGEDGKLTAIGSLEQFEALTADNEGTGK